MFCRSLSGHRSTCTVKGSIYRYLDCKYFAARLIEWCEIISTIQQDGRRRRRGKERKKMGRTLTSKPFHGAFRGEWPRKGFLFTILLMINVVLELWDSKIQRFRGSEYKSQSQSSIERVLQARETNNCYGGDIRGIFPMHNPISHPAWPSEN